MKKITFFGRHPDRFWVDLDFQLGGPRVDLRVTFGSFLLALGTLLGPRWLREAPRAFKIACNNLVDFWSTFVRFFMAFRLNSGVLLCWFAGCLAVCLACLPSSLLAAGCPYSRHGGGDGPQGNWIRRLLCLHASARRVQDIQARPSRPPRPSEA